MNTFIVPLPLLIMLVAGCGAPAWVEPPPKDQNARQSAVILSKVLELGRDGDWVVASGYHWGDRIVSTATRTPISHAAVVDSTHKEVVESLSDGVRLTSLRDFIDKSHRIILIRPIWSIRDRAAGEDALATARKWVGQKYDYLGTLGIDRKKRFYCSELALRSYGSYFQKNEEIPRVIEPDQLYLWGTIIYDSRPRNEW